MGSSKSWTLSRRTSPSGTPAADALGAEHRIERSAELGVPVAEEEPNTRKPLVDGEVPGLPGDPPRVGVRGDTGHVHSAGRELDEEQDVDRL